MKKLLILLILIFNIFILNVNAKELPKLYIDGNIYEMINKKDVRDIKILYQDGNTIIESYATLKIQGSSSTIYDKKNYTIKFFEDEKHDKKNKIDFGWGKQNQYVLKANWIDETHARNIVSARIVSQIQKKYNLFVDTPNYGQVDGYPIEVYENDNFLGLYTLNIPKDKWMFNMSDDEENNIIISSESNMSDSNKLIEKINEDDPFFEIEQGEESQKTYDKLNKVISFINDSSDKEFKQKINEYINLDSILNYYIMVMYANLKDNVLKNVLYVSYDGKLWYVSLYDLDLSWGSIENTAMGMPEGNDEDYYVEQNLLFKRIRDNFPNELANRYFELRKTILNYENIVNEFNKFENEIPKEILKKEHERWENIPEYDLNRLEDFVKNNELITDKLFSNIYTIKPGFTKTYNNNNGIIELILKPNRYDIVLDDNNIYEYNKSGKYILKYSTKNGNEYELKINISSLDFKLNNYLLNHKIILLSPLLLLIPITLIIIIKKLKKRAN